MAKKYSDLKDACWKGYKAVGMKDKNGRKVPNCIPEDNNKLITPIKQKSDDHKSYYNFLAAKAKLGKPFSNKEKDFVKSYKLMTQEELEHIDEIRGLDPVSQKALAKQRLTNLIKSGRGRGALVANQMRTLRAEELEISEESLEQLYEVLSKDAEASDWIKDFVHSTNPKFEGKSKEERIKMALGAYYAQARRKQQTEEVEQIDEISQMAHAKYQDAARKNIKELTPHVSGEYGDIAKNIINRRIKGLTASSALKFRDQYKPKQQSSMKEEIEELDELSKSTLASYAKKATKDARMQQSIGKDFEASANKSRKPSMKDAAQSLSNKYKSKSRSREAGIGKAIDRLAKEEVEMKKETKEDKKDSIPFDGPYKKFTGTTTDKSGAKHTAMSQVRHLARMAMKKQMSVKESLKGNQHKIDKNKNGKIDAHDFKLLNKEGVLGTVAGGTLGALAGGPLGALAGAYLGHKAQQAGTNAKEVNKKLKKEEVSNTGPVKVKVQIAGNEPHEEKWETAKKKPVKEEYDEEGNVTYSKISFKEFNDAIMEARAQYLVKATHKDTGRVKVSNYVADKDESEFGVRSRAEREHKPSGYQIDSVRRKDVEAHGEGDEEESTIEKRGRGRPAGAKSGARGPRIK